MNQPLWISSFQSLMNLVTIEDSNTRMDIGYYDTPQDAIYYDKPIGTFKNTFLVDCLRKPTLRSGLSLQL